MAGLALLFLGILLAIQQSAVFGFGGLLLAAIGAYLIVFGAWQTSRMLLVAVVAVIVTGAALALATDPVRRGLFGMSETDTGVIGKQIHWTAKGRWRPLIVLGVLLAVLLVLAIVMSAFSRRQKHPVSPRVDRAYDALALVSAALIVVMVVIALAGGLVWEFRHN
jgi:hypothetical protein